MRNVIFLLLTVLLAAAAPASWSEDGTLKGSKKIYCFAYTATVESTASFKTANGPVNMPIVKYEPRPVACPKDNQAKVSTDVAAANDLTANTIELSINETTANKRFDADKVQRMLLRVFANGQLHPNQWKYKDGMHPAPQSDLTPPKFHPTADEGPPTVHGCICWDELVCEPTLSGLILCRRVRQCSCWN